MQNFATIQLCSLKNGMNMFTTVMNVLPTIIKEVKKSPEPEKQFGLILGKILGGFLGPPSESDSNAQ